MSLQTNMFLTRFNFVPKIIFDMAGISGLSWWTFTLATLIVESWNFLWRAITDLLNTALVTSVLSKAFYSLEPKKMKRRETYITHVNNSLVKKKKSTGISARHPLNRYTCKEITHVYKVG